MKKTLLMSLIFGIMVLVSCEKKAERPNIILILADDFGYMDCNAYAQKTLGADPADMYYETPHLDRLASEGLRLTNFNVEVQCTPSRSALMTGRYAIRSGNGTVPLGEGVYGLVQWEVTMAEMLSEHPGVAHVM